MKKEFVLIIFLLIAINLISATEEKISLEIGWNDKNIINGEEFSIEIKVHDLEEKNYDLKVFILDSNDKIISQTYNNEKWVTSNNYIKNIFSGSGDKDENIKLRINKNYKQFKGDAKIKARLRETGSSSYKKEEENIITIIKGKEETSNQEEKTVSDDEIIQEDFNTAPQSQKTNDNTKTIQNSSSRVKSEIKTSIENYTSISAEVIHLGKIKDESESIKSNEHNIVYQSSNEAIKKYSVYIFIFLLIIFFAIFVFLKFRKKVKYNAE
jgi:hypothetical protein